jgi:hypothetical protein
VPLSVLRGQAVPGDRWTEHDRSVAVALTLYEATVCTGCGQPLEESTSPEADAGNREGAWHYEAPVPDRCHACTALAVTQEQYSEAHAPHALRWRAQRIDHDDAAEVGT